MVTMIYILKSEVRRKQILCMTMLLTTHSIPCRSFSFPLSLLNFCHLAFSCIFLGEPSTPDCLSSLRSVVHLVSAESTSWLALSRCLRDTPVWSNGPAHSGLRELTQT